MAAARVFCSLVVLSAVAGCSAKGAGTVDDDIQIITPPSRVFVTNNNQLDIRVFALDRSLSIPLGSVGSFTSEVFELPNAVLSRGQVRIMADPIGSVTAYLTDLITFSAGQDIELIVQNNLQLSSYALR